MKLPSVVIAVGYSVRSLVEACSRAGLDCVAVDHFGDADTRAFAKGRWIKLDLIEDRLIARETLAAIEKLAWQCREAEPVAFLLAGGMENLSEAVEQLRSVGTVYGPNETQRKRLRDWQFLRAVAIEADMEFPSTLVETEDDALRERMNFESWLWKPTRGGGGLKIGRFDESYRMRGTGYWQQHIAGRQLGVSCVLQADGCSIVGATRALDAKEWPGPSEFIYRGSIGPIQLNTDAERQINKLCVTIRQQLDFSGLLQFDFIQSADNRLWLLECNPRWTAGTEVLLGLYESGNQARRLIVDGMLVQGLYLNAARWKSEWSYAKAIVYANKELPLSEQMVLELQRYSNVSTGTCTWLADIPHAAQTIEPGHPIATVRAALHNPSNSLNEAEVDSQLLLKLHSHADRFYHLIESSGLVSVKHKSKG